MNLFASAFSEKPIFSNCQKEMFNVNGVEVEYVSVPHNHPANNIGKYLLNVSEKWLRGKMQPPDTYGEIMDTYTANV